MSRLKIGRTSMRVSSAFVSSLKTSSLSVMRLVVTFRRRFRVRVPSSTTRGVGAMHSTISCVRGRVRWFVLRRNERQKLLFPQGTTIQEAPRGDKPRFQPSIFLEFYPVGRCRGANGLVRVV